MGFGERFAMTVLMIRMLRSSAECWEQSLCILHLLPFFNTYSSNFFKREVYQPTQPNFFSFLLNQLQSV